MKQTKKKKWTVILLYPGYLANDYGSDIYTDWTTCADPYGAVKLSQKKACKAQGVDVVNNPTDFGCIAVIPGWVKIVLDANSF